MIFKQLKAAGLAAAAVALAVSAWGQAPAPPKAGDYYGGSPFQVISGKNNHQYALEQIAGTKTITGYPVYASDPPDDSIPAVMGFSAGDQQKPLVKLILDTDKARAPDDSAVIANTGATLPMNSKGLITFQLIGAEFREGISNADLKFINIASYLNPLETTMEAAIIADTPIASAQKSAGGTLGSGGGAAGDSYVTFEVTVGAADLSTPGYAFVLPIPTLQNVNPNGVYMKVTMDSLTLDFPPFQAERRYKKDGESVDLDADAAPTVRVLPRSADAISVNFTAAGPSDIYLEGRQQLVQTAEPLKLTNFIRVASAGVSLTSGVLQTNGKPMELSGADHLVLDITGISDSDVVFLNTRAPLGAVASDTGEALTVSGATANGAFGMASFSGNANLYVQVDGKRILSPGVLMVTAKASFGSGIQDLTRSATGRVVPAGIMKGEVEVRYAGTAGPLPRAFAIAPGSSGDTSNVRVRCDSAAPCQIYFACNDTMGGDVFGKVADPIAPRATMVLRDGGGGTAVDLRSVFDEGTWMSGRLSCDVIAPGTNVEVQVLTRSGDTLVNNTYVEG